jgi:hypothetical protein
LGRLAVVPAQARRLGAPLFHSENGKLKVANEKKGWDPYLRGISTAKVVPINGTWLKRSDKRADALRPRGDAFEGSAEELKLRDARK